MLLRKRSTFFVAKYPPCIVEAYCLSSFPYRRSLFAIPKHPTKFCSKRTYATQRPNFGGSTNNAGGGIPLGQIHLGSGKVSPQKGIAIKDDITKSWKELTIPQKIVRTGTQTTNLAVVILSIGVLVLYPLGSKLTTKGVVVYYLTVAVFLPTSETAIFSKAFNRVRKDPQVLLF